jgi:signal transduction histidine kinase
MIIGNNRFFIVSLLLLVIGVALVWMVFTPEPYAPASGNGIVLRDHAGIYQVNERMEYLEDKAGAWTLEDVRSPHIDAQFRQASGQSAFGLTAGTYWVRTTVVNESPNGQWVIRLNNSVVEQFELHIFGDSAAGVGQPRIVGKADEHFQSYFLHLPEHEPVTLYLRIVINGSMIIPIEMMEVNDFLGKLKNEYIFFGIYYGFVLLMAAYMLSMYIFNRLAVYLYYSLYILCFSVSQLVWNGLLQELFGTDGRVMALLLRLFGNYESIDYFFFISSLWFGLLFLGRILRLDVYAPCMLVVYRVLNIVSPIIILAAFLHQPGYETLAIMYESLFAILLVICTCLCVMRGNLAARYVILAAIPFLGLAMPTILNTFSLMQESFLTHYGFQFGSMAEFVMFSIALSYQVRQHRIDKENAVQLMKVTEQIQRTRNELLQEISHDIRTPLTIVQGGIQAMIHGVEIEPGGNANLLKSMYDEVLYINSFIDHLFELSRLKEAHESAALEPIRFAEWIAREFDSIASTIRLAERQCESVVTVDSGAVVRMHPRQIRRVLSNLVSNACKFSPAGSTVSLHARSSKHEVTVVVRDEGSGIPPEHLDSVFERAYKVNPSDPKSGSGLGLAIAREIIVLHNGTIRADSPPGGGSEFTFRLPVVP